MDHWSKEKRSEVMRKIKGKNTKPELILRSGLFRLGYRFRIHKEELPGKPDIVLPKYNAIIFVHGCFWHVHKDCRRARIPSTNSKYWKQKLEKNLNRDKRCTIQLEKLGWNVITIWECEIEKGLKDVLNKIELSIHNICTWII